MRVDLDDGNSPGTSEKKRGGGGGVTFAGCLVLLFILVAMIGFFTLWVMSFIGGVMYFFHQFM